MFYSNNSRNKPQKDIWWQLRFFISTYLLFFATVYSQQIVIEGKVTDSITKEPIPFVSIYLSGTTIGTLTNSEGIYRLESILKGRYEIVAAIVGNESTIISIDITNDEKKVVNFSLKPIHYEFNSIDVEDKIPQEWIKQLVQFKKLLLGNNIFAEECKILNEYRIDFIENDAVFLARLEEPLIIENNALGYKINCIIKDFEYRKTSKKLSYKVYPVFTEIVPSTKDLLEDFHSNRLEAYLGSTTHFFNSLISDENDFHDEGFQISYMNNYRNAIGAVYMKEELITNDDRTGYFVLNPSSGSKNIYGTKSNFLKIEYWRDGKRTTSWITGIPEFGIELDPSGYIISSDRFSIHGEMGKEGVATMLPRFWKPAPIEN